MARHCGNCGQAGHYKSTCKNSKTEEVSTSSSARTLQEKGREILAEKRRKNKALVGERKAERGLWIVNPERKRIAGQIARVKRSGVIVWREKEHILDIEYFTVKSKPETLERSGYILSDKCPQDIEWSFLDHGAWRCRK